MLTVGGNFADVLRWPVIGRSLRWRHARTSIQLVLLLAAALVVLHGLWGPPLGSNNLATVLTWVHYRGLLVVALLAAGNLFCSGCPFVLVRDLGRRARRPTARWPRRLRTKWAAIVLFVAVLFAYELFDLWALPAATAYLVLSYFAAALVVDLVFAGATFCKYLCPIGQFNFVASTISPLELRVRERDVCRACKTADCIKGRRASPAAPIVQRGCELGLFLPMKVGNMDCTFCLDCVQACPHDNIALATRIPGAELIHAGRRSGIGRFAQRRDIAALAVLFAFGGLLNAFAMTRPIYGLERWLFGVMGVTSETPVLAIVFVGGLAVLPMVLMYGAAALTRWLGAGGNSLTRIVMNYSYALVPFGMGVWLAHYGFHLLTGFLTAIPITQSAAIDVFGSAVFGEPHWRWAGMRPGAVFPIQLGFIVLGAIGSCAVAGQISDRDYPHRRQFATFPWAAVVVALAATAIWILWQPMEMRGLGFAG